MENECTTLFCFKALPWVLWAQALYILYQAEVSTLLTRAPKPHAVRTWTFRCKRSMPISYFSHLCGKKWVQEYTVTLQVAVGKKEVQKHQCCIKGQDIWGAVLIYGLHHELILPWYWSLLHQYQGGTLSPSPSVSLLDFPSALEGILGNISCVPQCKWSLASLLPS